jgi:hypothetical protein
LSGALLLLLRANVMLLCQILDAADQAIHVGVEVSPGTDLGSVSVAEFL